MEKFSSNIYSIYEIINKAKDTKTLINITVVSKQYLVYYLYRVFIKFINIFENAITTKELNDLIKLLRIPTEHNLQKPYPLVGKMVNDEKILDIIILSFIEIFNKTDKYLKSLANDVGHNELINFLTIKSLETILEDLFDLQKLIPGLSVSAIRPNYIDDEQL